MTLTTLLICTGKRFKFIKVTYIKQLKKIKYSFILSPCAYVLLFLLLKQNFSFLHLFA